MKIFLQLSLILSSLILSLSALAAPLTPITSTSRSCNAVVIEASYKVDAVCWKNQDAELRMWFPQATFDALRETGIETRNIINLNQACAQTAEYKYEDLFGASALPATAVRTNSVEILVSQLDVSACFSN